MTSYSSFSAVAEGKLFKPGDVILHEWYQRFLLEDGNADVVAIIMLGDIVAWYRNGTGAYGGYFGDQAPILDGDSLILSYEYYERKFGFKEHRARRSLTRLDEHHVLKRGFKNIAVDGKRINKLVITLDLAFFGSCFVDPELDIRGRGRKKKSGGLLSCDDHISHKTLEFKDRSTELKSNFFENSFEEKTLQPSTTEFERTGYSLASFYPLGQSDINNLKELCGREFSGNAINEILLNLSKKLPSHVFPSKKAFTLYMSKALTYELRDTTRISNESFRIKANMTINELEGTEQEAFLTKIENNRDTSLESVISRKLAGVLEPSVAYALLMVASFPKNIEYADLNNDAFKISLKRTVELTTSQYDLILSEVKSVYGNHINSLKFELSCKPAVKNQASSASAIFKGVWGRVRQGLISTCGEAIDRNWFAKLEAVEDQDKLELKLKAPNSFIRDWIESNYQHLIESVCMRENYRLSGVTL